MNKQPTNQPPEGLSKHLYDICAVCGGRRGLHNNMNQRCPKDINSTGDHTEYRDTVFSSAPPATVVNPSGLQDDWKDVESAPKDRTEILGYDYNTESIYIVLWSPVLGNGAWMLPTGNYLPRITHWRPLPNKPGEPNLTTNELNLLKETVKNQHALILSAEQRGYEKAKEEFTQPLGIEVEQEADNALEIWEKNIPSVLNELLSDFAINHTYPVRGIIRVLLTKIIAAILTKKREGLAGYAASPQSSTSPTSMSVTSKWINQHERPVDPHTEIIAVIGSTKYMAYVGSDKTIWPLGLADFKPFPSSKIEKYLIIPSINEHPQSSTSEEEKEVKQEFRKLISQLFGSGFPETFIQEIFSTYKISKR